MRLEAPSGELTVFANSPVLNAADPRYGGIDPTGEADSAAAIALALEEAEEISGTVNFNLVQGAVVLIPQGKYRLDTGLAISTGNNIALMGAGFGSTMLFTHEDIAMITLGDPTHADICRRLSVLNLHLCVGEVGDTAAANSILTTGIKVHDVIYGRLQDLFITNFFNGIDAYRMNTMTLDNLHIEQNQRTNAGGTGLALRGRPSGTPSSSGSNKISNIDIRGQSAAAGNWATGILVRACDTLWAVNTHQQYCNWSIVIGPDNTTFNKTLGDIMFTQNYADACNTGCVQITGTSADDGFYGAMKFTSCRFTGGNGVGGGGAAYADYPVDVGVLMSASGVTNELDLSFTDCTFKNGGVTFIRVQGTTASFSDIRSLTLMGNKFEDSRHDESGATTKVNAEVQSFVAVGNQHFADYTDASPTYGVRCYQISPTSGQSALVVGDNFGLSNVTGSPVNITSTNGNKTTVLGNVLQLQDRLAAVTANDTFVIQPGYAIRGIYIVNTTANAVTTGIKIGTTSGATDVVASQAVGASAAFAIADASILKRVFSTTADQTLFIQTLGAWNSASLTIRFDLVNINSG